MLVKAVELPVEALTVADLPSSHLPTFKDFASDIQRETLGVGSRDIGDSCSSHGLGDELGVERGGNKNHMESRLPVRCSRRVTTKGK